MSRSLPPGVHRVTSRGREYYYYQPGRNTARASGRIRLPDDPRDPEWWAAYAALARLPAPVVATNAVRKLADAWQRAPEWRQMSVKTQTEWSRYLARIVAAWGDLDVRGIEPKHVIWLRDQWADKPATANNLLRCLSSMLGWSVPRGWRADNPCREVRPLKGGEGYAPWPWHVIEETRAALEDKRPDLWWAVALALYTGQRAGDCLAMRWDAVRDGTVTVVQGKTGKRLSVPIHRDLHTVLADVPRRALTVLTSSEGRPWTGDGFKTSWRKHRPACTSGLVFHGLRKSAVCVLLEAGCTDAEVASVTGQSREMVEHYARAVNQERLARSAISKWERA